MVPEGEESSSFARLAAGESLLGRFDPDSPRHFDVDQHFPDEPPSLRPDALRFDRTPKSDTGLPALFFGCSVFRGDVLDRMGLPGTVVLDPPYVGLAVVSAQDARKVGQEQQPNPVGVVEDPIRPVRADGSDRYNWAHALITFSAGLSRSQRDKLVTKLCRKMRILWLRPVL